MEQTLSFFSLRQPVSCLSHLFAFVLAVIAIIHMLKNMNGRGVKILVLIVYGFSILGLFLSSAIYHGPDLSFHHIAFFRLVDLSAIFGLIGGTNLACSLVAYRPGLSRSLAICAICGFTAAGVLTVWAPIDLPTNTFTYSYLALGWFGAAALPGVYSRLGVFPVILVLSGGLLYTSAGLSDQMGWPILIPKVVGPHEVSHVFEILGAAVFHVFILRYVLPIDKVS